MAREAEGGGRRERARETVAKINKRWRRVGRSGQVRLCAALARSAESRGRTENAQTRHRRQIEARARGRSGTRARCKTGWGGGGAEAGRREGDLCAGGNRRGRRNGCSGQRNLISRPDGGRRVARFRENARAGVRLSCVYLAPHCYFARSQPKKGTRDN